MYTKYFGFSEKPFTLTPNPRFIYLSKNHKEAFAHLLYGINNHYGFIELIGEVGTGKTTVLRTLLNQLQEENYRTALIVNPCLTGVELLRSIIHEFGLASESEYANDLLTELNNFLLFETTQGRTVVLVIDEAQNLQPDVLEQIRLISNLETENDKLIQIILAGQPELGVLLERPELRQLNQRIAVRYRLNSMSMPETRSYIRHRMEVAGETGGVSFSPFAIRLIYLYTRGVPRMINILCDRSLLIGYGDERRRITSSIVTRAIKELLNIPQRKRYSLAIIGLIFIVILSIAILSNIKGGTTWLTSKSSPAQTVYSTSAKTMAAPVNQPKTGNTVPASTNQQAIKLQQDIQSFDQNDVHLLAFNAVAEKWGVNPIKVLSDQLTVPKMYSLLAARRNLTLTTFKGTLDEIIRFDLPFFLMTKSTGELGSYCIAVTAIKGDTISITPPLLGSSTLSKNDLSSIANGTFYIAWKNSAQIPTTIKPGDKRFEIRSLQIFLNQAGMYKEPINGIYTPLTAKAVSDFQKSSGIKNDNSVGELTLAALSKFHTSQKVPSISATGHSK